MQLRKILIPVAVTFAALSAAIVATPASAVMPAPPGAARTCEPHVDEGAANPGPYVAYPEGEVVFAARTGASTE